MLKPPAGCKPSSGWNLGQRAVRQRRKANCAVFWLVRYQFTSGWSVLEFSEANCALKVCAPPPSQPHMHDKHLVKHLQIYSSCFYSSLFSSSLTGVCLRGRAAGEMLRCYTLLTVYCRMYCISVLSNPVHPSLTSVLWSECNNKPVSFTFSGACWVIFHLGVIRATVLEFIFYRNCNYSYTGLWPSALSITGVI